MTRLSDRFADALAELVLAAIAALAEAVGLR